MAYMAHPIWMWKTIEALPLSVALVAKFSAIERSSDVDMNAVSTPPITPCSSGSKKLDGSTPPAEEAQATAAARPAVREQGQLRRRAEAADEGRLRVARASGSSRQLRARTRDAAIDDGRP
jgi:hypothetical protein